VTIKDMSRDLVSTGQGISETMAIRCLHRDESKRLGTIEAIEAISDYLGLPSCVAIAESMLEAIAFHGAIQLVQAESDRVKISNATGRARPKP